MAMLNYLGANPAPGLTMPGGMPGAGGPSDPLTPPPAPSPMGPAMDMGGMGGMGPMGGMGFPGVGMTDPAGRQYEAVTQEDGSVLLHMKNPDGSRGPAVKIIPPIKSRKPGM